MAEYKNIVFGTDFSEGANRAFEEAQYIARVAGGKLHVVHVTGQSSAPVEGGGSLPEKYPGENIEYKVLRGHEAQELMSYAEGLDAPLLVVGARGVGIVTGLFGGGSICDKVVANATCPVLVVPHG